ncbi:hypothetical protein C471_10956 [Halorubrum saccharovorum DSM 1137]|uniref:DUF1616 domain-containing protein n=1 Tax=Halorubrum saccharovorum DSM 1137 TaxID=1227484 RepID=M0DTD6_9EURY|nr:DUF1616 domain-containing protein [Halorubrum saccharovorum]ELZ38098.1 hypothetical protein C471_10956 [Halorubrum saccharovorum DSM 1137]
MTRKPENDNAFDDAPIAADVNRPDRSPLAALRRSPDIATALAVAIAADAFALAPVVRDTSPRVVFGFLLVLWAPGYAVIAALFPPAAEEGDAPLDGFERAALSIAASALVAGASGVALSVLSVGVRPAPLALALTAVTVGASAVALARRMRPGTPRVEVPTPGVSVDDRLTVAFVALAVAAVAVAGFAVASPPEPYATLSIASADGSALTDDARTIAPGESVDLAVAVRNREREAVTYTVVVVARPAGAAAPPDASAGGSGGTADPTELHRFSRIVAPGETWRRPHSASPPFPDDRTRVEYLLYRDAPPDAPTIANADESVHVWFTATDA